jgi:hypothetical protein
MFATKSPRSPRCAERLFDRPRGRESALIQWCYASGEVDGATYASVDLKIDGPAITVPTHAADQLQQLRDRNRLPEPNPASAP